MSFIPAISLRNFFLALQIGLAPDHDPLGLGRTGAVHGLRAVADGCRSQGDVLDQPQDAHPVLRGHGSDPFQIFLNIGAGPFVAQVFLRGHGDHDSPGDILGEAGDLVGKPGHILLADVGQEHVDFAGAGFRLVPLGGAGQPAGVKRFVQMDHLGDLVDDMRGFGRPVIIRGEGGGADQDVADPHLAPSIALAVEAGKPLHQKADEIGFPAKEDPFPGDEDVFENGQDFVAAEVVVAHIDRASLELARVARLPAADEKQAGRIGGDGAADGIILFVFPESHGGHDDDFMGVEHAGLVGFGAPNDDPVLPALHDMKEHVRVLLLRGAEAAVSFDIGHGAVDHQVLLLNPQEKFLEPLVIGGLIFLVDFEGGAVKGVHGVHAHAALEAGGRLLPQEALHLHLVHQVFRGLVDGGEAVDRFSRQVGFGGGQFLCSLPRGRFDRSWPRNSGRGEGSGGRPDFSPALPGGRPPDSACADFRYIVPVFSWFLSRWKKVTE